MEALDKKPGLKTMSGGEIFNDYENNQAYAPNSTAVGTGTSSNKAKLLLDISIIRGNNFMGYDPSIDVSGTDVSKIERDSVLLVEVTFENFVNGMPEPISSGTKTYTVKVRDIEENQIHGYTSLYVENYPFEGDHTEIIKSKVYLNTIYGPQFVEGAYNIMDTEEKYLHIVGNGSSDINRSNAYTLDAEGNGWFKNGVSAGIVDSGIQSPSSQVGAKAFSFVIDHEYSEEDIAEKRYYLTYVTDNMLYKPFSIVLGENYDFLGTITSVNKEENYITVDNYKTPNKDSNTTIYDSSYILLPYDRIDASDDYTWNSQYVNEGAHLLGDTIIGTGGTSFGYDNHVLAIGGISAGLSNISAGKYSGTFGRYNVTGYCDFALGQNMKILGHWNAGFGRDNFINTTSDYSIVSGLRNEIYNKYCSASGRGHVMKFDDSSARGRYSEIDTAYRYVDRVGYGTGDNDRKNIYTLDKNGNVWFRGNLRVGGNNYDEAKDPLGVREVSSLGELTLTPSALGDVVQIPHSIAQWNREYSQQIKLQSVTGDCQYENVSVNDVDCIKILKRPGGIYYAYFKLTDFSDSKPSNTDYKIRIKYLDNGNDAICFGYTTTSGHSSQKIQRTNTGEWKTHIWSVENALFDSDTPYQNENHIRFYTEKEKEEVYLAEVSIERGKDIYILTSSEADGYKNINNWKNLLKNDNAIHSELLSVDFFKELPEGKTIDDLNTPNDVGCYVYNEVITKTSDVTGTEEEYISPTLLIVGGHNYDVYDESRVCQTKISCDPMNSEAGNIIQHRTYSAMAGDWSYWQHPYNKTYNVANISTLLSTKCNVGDMAICNKNNDIIVYNAKLGNFDASIGNLKMWTSTTNLDMDCYGEDAVIGGKACRKCGDIKNNTTTEKYKAGRNRMMYFTVPDINAVVNDAIIKFSYYDLGTHTIEIKDAPTASGRRIGIFNLTDTKTWKEKIISVEDLYLTKLFNGQDIRFHCASDLTDESTFKNLYISDVTVYVPSSSIANGSEYHKEKEVYMLIKDNYTDINNWVKINK